jgi:hypothetical protein
MKQREQFNATVARNSKVRTLIRQGWSLPQIRAQISISDTAYTQLAQQVRAGARG